ncbi:UNVERIFIED_CONTAM: hypothetical protein HDU68_011073 [Siphonaria sp. JEL0065]|nr:hypothetical protein HDU68_011073 [Siphonaria sp. JEL0065]
MDSGEKPLEPTVNVYNALEALKSKNFNKIEGKAKTSVMMNDDNIIEHSSSVPNSPVRKQVLKQRQRSLSESPLASRSLFTAEEIRTLESAIEESDGHNSERAVRTDQDDATSEGNSLRDEFNHNDLVEPGPVPSKMPQACIFVANLDSTKSDSELHEKMWDKFSHWGQLLEVKIDRDTTLDMPFAFIQFKNIADAKRALVEARGEEIDGRQIRIEAANVIRTLRIKYDLKYSVGEIEEYMLQFGPMEDFTFLRYRDTGDSKGVVYVKYFSRPDAIKCYLKIRKLRYWTIEWIKKDKKRSEVDQRSLYVAKLNPDCVSEPLLHTKFKKYGKIEQIKLFKAENRPCFAFIRFSNENDAELAMDELHGSRWLDRIIKVQYREVEPVKTSWSSHPVSYGAVPSMQYATSIQFQQFPYNALPSTRFVPPQVLVSSPLRPLNPAGLSFGPTNPILNRHHYSPQLQQQPQPFFVSPTAQYQTYFGLASAGVNHSLQPLQNSQQSQLPQSNSQQQPHLSSRSSTPATQQVSYTTYASTGTSATSSLFNPYFPYKTYSTSFHQQQQQFYSIPQTSSTSEYSDPLTPVNNYQHPQGSLQRLPLQQQQNPSGPHQQGTGYPVTQWSPQIPAGRQLVMVPADFSGAVIDPLFFHDLGQEKEDIRE